MAAKERLGLIAGNGKFPFLVLDAARAQGYDVVVAAIKEETFPEIESHGAASVHWLSLGELSKLIDTFKAEGVTRAVMAGQVKHKQIFSSIMPENSTALLEPLLAKTGVLTNRAPSAQERKNIEYGRVVARRLTEYDIGQTVVIAEAACVAVEAMEGTDATIERAGQLMRSLELESKSHSDSEPSTLSRALTVVKVAKPTQDMRFDVPVIGLKTIETMARAGATCLAVDAGRCLLLDGEAMTRAADHSGIAVCAE